MPIQDTALADQVAALEARLAKKDQEVEQLREEGTKLSEQQMRSVNTNKKLQARSKEADAAAVVLNNRIADQDQSIIQFANSIILTSHHSCWTGSRIV